MQRNMQCNCIETATILSLFIMFIETTSYIFFFFYYSSILRRNIFILHEQNQSFTFLMYLKQHLNQDKIMMIITQIWAGKPFCIREQLLSKIKMLMII